MSRFLEKEDIRALELINEEVKDEELRNKLLEIYIQSFRKEEHYQVRHGRKNVSIDQDTKQSNAIISEISCDQEQIHQLTMKKEEIKELYKAISQLDEAERNLIWLFFFCEVSLVEIAERLGLTKQALSKRKLKVEEKLRKIMQK
ncbi:MAG: sigma-70 family RNA polymerase sigma factor [Erysipelotrichaceae bacterium]|uniref:sigma-70 family RNA polymerase sigma factor n=1 Tax=Anaerorhabdus sp. TaxID=1872524 RepID=UPI002FC83361